jgi:hypothetical protein
VRRLALRDICVFGADAGEQAAILFEIAAELATHASFTSFSIYNMSRGMPPAVLEAVAEAVRSHPHVRACRLWDCGIGTASLPVLLRLASAPALHELAFDFSEYAMGDADVVAPLGAALRENDSLTSLMLDCMWGQPAFAAVILRALTGHPSLRKLGLNYAEYDLPDEAQTQAVAGAALGALVAANAPALQEVELCESNVYDAGLGPLCDALPHNTHLRTLVCDNSGWLPRKSQDDRRRVGGVCARPAAARGARQHVADAPRPGGGAVGVRARGGGAGQAAPCFFCHDRHRTRRAKCLRRRQRRLTGAQRERSR